MTLLCTSLYVVCKSKFQVMLGLSTILQAMRVELRQIHTHNFCFLEAIMMIKKGLPCSEPYSISDVLSLNLKFFTAVMVRHLDIYDPILQN